MTQMQFIDGGFAWDDDFPLSQAVRVGNTLYLAGQVAIDREGRVVGEGDIVAQSRQCFENMREVLAEAGATFRDVVRLTTYFTADLSDIAATRAYWSVRKEYFGDHRPASTGLQVKGLIYPSLLLEVDAIAVIPDGR